MYPITNMWPIIAKYLEDWEVHIIIRYLGARPARISLSKLYDNVVRTGWIDAYHYLQRVAPINIYIDLFIHAAIHRQNDMMDVLEPFVRMSDVSRNQRWWMFVLNADEDRVIDFMPFIIKCAFLTKGHLYQVLAEFINRGSVRLLKALLIEVETVSIEDLDSAAVIINPNIHLNMDMINYLIQIGLRLWNMIYSIAIKTNNMPIIAVLEPILAPAHPSLVMLCAARCGLNDVVMLAANMGSDYWEGSLKSAISYNNTAILSIYPPELMSGALFDYRWTNAYKIIRNASIRRRIIVHHEHAIWMSDSDVVPFIIANLFDVDSLIASHQKIFARLRPWEFGRLRHRVPGTATVAFCSIVHRIMSMRH